MVTHMQGNGPLCDDIIAISLTIYSLGNVFRRIIYSVFDKADEAGQATIRTNRYRGLGNRCGLEKRSTRESRCAPGSRYGRDSRFGRESLWLELGDTGL